MSKQARSRGQAGFGLIELMVALVLGLIVIGGAISVFASNRQTFRTTEALSRVQETMRAGFEIMARDVRDAAGTPCSKNIPIANVLDGAAGNWMYDWGAGLQGFEPSQAITSLPTSGVGSRSPGTDAIVVHSGGLSGAALSQPAGSTNQFSVNSLAHGLQTGDLIILCDYRQATIMQVTSAGPGSRQIGHSAMGGTPGNCTNAMGFPVNCSSPVNYEYQPNAVVAKLTTAVWYVGENLRGGRSLFRKIGGPTLPEEIVDGVTDLQLRYLVTNAAAYVNSTAVASWLDVKAVRIQLTIVSPESVALGNQPLSRQIVHYAALRNRNQ